VGRGKRNWRTEKIRNLKTVVSVSHEASQFIFRDIAPYSLAEDRTLHSHSCEIFRPYVGSSLQVAGFV
jgi:hypothetical protein